MLEETFSVELADFEEYKILGGRRRKVLEMPLWKGIQCGQGLGVPSGGSLTNSGDSRVPWGPRGLHQRC